MARVTNSSEFLGVSEASRLIGVSTDTIRRWDKKGLLRAARGNHGERIFSIDALRKVLNQQNGLSHKWEVLTAAPTDLTVGELFAGAGGMALGLSNAGFKTKLLVDNNKDCVSTLLLNRPKWDSRCLSVTDLDSKDVPARLDVLAGGFPCQAFSYAGMRRGFDDARGTLFYEFARIIRDTQPRLVIGENVRGLLTHDNGRTLQTMVEILKELNYRVTYRVLRAQFHDVAQKRERLVIFALHEDESSPLLYPEENDSVVTMRDALADVPTSPGMEYSPSKAAVMELVPEGGYWKDLPDSIQRKFMGGSYHLGGGKTGMARRLAWDEPSLTLTCNPAQKQTERCHPSETRPLSVREYARIQSFPDNWEFAGSVSSQYKQIGNAVPVNLGFHIGIAARNMLGKPARLGKNAIKLEEVDEV
jgi:DNA (cytosine-5)-methyltransferase 1